MKKKLESGKSKIENGVDSEKVDQGELASSNVQDEVCKKKK